MGLLDYQLSGRRKVAFFEIHSASVAAIHSLGRFQVRVVTSFFVCESVVTYIRKYLDEIVRIGAQGNLFILRRAFLALVIQLHYLLQSCMMASAAPSLAIIG